MLLEVGSDSLRLIFAGTPAFAAISLEALLAQGRHEVVAVYARPDRPAGRGRAVTAGAVKQLALKHGLPVRQPARLDEAEVAGLAAYKPDAVIVAAYGLLLPPALLELPRLGCINIHASLLPRWRGAAPIERAILAGDVETGVTLMRMVPALDSGPILAQRRCLIGEQDTAGDLHDKLAALGAELLLEKLPAIAASGVQAAPQDERLATYARKIIKTEARLDWRRPAVELARAARAFNPRPGATAILGGREIKVLRVHPVRGPVAGPPGTIIHAGPEGIDVQTGDGLLRLQTLQAPGRRPVTAADYLNAHPELRPPHD